MGSSSPSESSTATSGRHRSSSFTTARRCSPSSGGGVPEALGSRTAPASAEGHQSLRHGLRPVVVRVDHGSLAARAQHFHHSLKCNPRLAGLRFPGYSPFTAAGRTAPAHRCAVANAVVASVAGRPRLPTTYQRTAVRRLRRQQPLPAWRALQRPATAQPQAMPRTAGHRLTCQQRGPACSIADMAAKSRPWRAAACASAGVRPIASAHGTDVL